MIMPDVFISSTCKRKVVKLPLSITASDRYLN